MKTQKTNPIAALNRTLNAASAAADAREAAAEAALTAEYIAKQADPNWLKDEGQGGEGKSFGTIETPAVAAPAPKARKQATAVTVKRTLDCFEATARVNGFTHYVTVGTRTNRYHRPIACSLKVTIDGVECAAFEYDTRGGSTADLYFAKIDAQPLMGAYRKHGARRQTRRFNSLAAALTAAIDAHLENRAETRRDIAAFCAEQKARREAAKVEAVAEQKADDASDSYALDPMKATPIDADIVRCEACGEHVADEDLHGTRTKTGFVLACQACRIRIADERDALPVLTWTETRLTGRTVYTAIVDGVGSTHLFTIHAYDVGGVAVTGQHSRLDTEFSLSPTIWSASTVIEAKLKAAQMAKSLGCC